MSSATKYLSAPERRAMTVQAVLELAAAVNPAEITTMAIAARMGLSQAAVFRHFATKDDVWQAVMEWVSEELLARARAAAAGAEGPLAALEAVFTAHAAFAVEHPGVPRIFFSELLRKDATPAKIALEAMLQEYGQLLSGLLERGRDAGEIDASVDPAVAVPMFIGAIQGLVIRSLLSGDMGRAMRLAPQTFDLYRRAVGRLP